jgi:hypothetical protein
MNRERTVPNNDTAVGRMEALKQGLLSEGVDYVPGWRKASFHILPEEAQSLYDKIHEVNLEFLFTGYNHFEGEEIEFRSPFAGVVYVEEKTYSDNHPLVALRGLSSSGLTLAMIYVTPGSYPTEIRISVGDSAEAEGMVFEEQDWPEYEGHGFTGFNLNAIQLESFRSLVDSFTQGKENQEISYEEEKVRTMWQDAQSGERFFYDPARQGYFSESGLSMEENDENRKPQSLNQDLTSVIMRERSALPLVADMRIIYTTSSISRENNPFIIKRPN